MSTLEIAELTKKRHADVMRDFRVQMQQLGGDDRRFASVYLDAKGEERACYNLPYDETMVLVTGYSIPLRAAVVKRWRELEEKEAGNALPNFQNPADAARSGQHRQGSVAPDPRGRG